VAAHVDKTQHIPFSEFLDMVCRHLIELLGQGISPLQGMKLTQYNTNRDRKGKHSYPEYDLNPQYQCSSGRREYIP